MTLHSIMRRALCAAALSLPWLTAAAQPAAPVSAQDAWARATTPGVSAGGVFVTLTSPSGDKLLTASSPAAAKASVHETQMEGTVMRMRPVEGGLPLPAGKAVKLSPGGYHIMLEGLKAPLKPGADVPVTLTFAQSPPLDITAHVMPVGSPGPGGMAAMPGMKMKMPGMEMK